MNMTILLIILGIIVALAVIIIGIYNRLVALRRISSRNLSAQSKAMPSTKRALSKKAMPSMKRALSKKSFRPVQPPWAHPAYRGKPQQKVC